VEEDRPHAQGLLEVAVSALDDLLALVAVQDGVGAQAAVFEVGGERVDAVGAGRLGDRLLVALEADRGAAVARAGLDVDEVGEPAREDLRDAAVDLCFGLVVAAAEAVADPFELLLGAAERPLAGGLDLALLLGGVDVGDAEAALLAGLGVGQLPVSDRAPVAGAQLRRQVALALADVAERPERLRPDVVQVALAPAAGAGLERGDEREPRAGPRPGLRSSRHGKRG
jgi:hypothetical protein